MTNPLIGINITCVTEVLQILYHIAIIVQWYSILVLNIPQMSLVYETWKGKNYLEIIGIRY